MYVGLSVVSVYLLLLPYFSANNDYQKVSLQLSSEQSVGDVVGLRSWTGREFHWRGPAAAKVLSP